MFWNGSLIGTMKTPTPLYRRLIRSVRKGSRGSVAAVPASATVRAVCGPLAATTAAPPTAAAISVSGWRWPVPRTLHLNPLSFYSFILYSYPRRGAANFLIFHHDRHAANHPQDLWPSFVGLRVSEWVIWRPFKSPLLCKEGMKGR